ncbi:MAG: DUF4783 domain-containing protein [Mangrovibacterium sp.]
MKHLYIFCLILCLHLIPQASWAQMPNGIILGLRHGDVKEISNYLGDNVELYLLDKDDVYSKNQATQILQQFFAQNKPSSLSMVHQSEKNEHQYAIMKLETSGGSYQVSVLVRSVSELVVISQLQIVASEL